MTNGGGNTEAVKARYLAELLGDSSIDESHVILSHTPMRGLVENYSGRRVMVIGSENSIDVAETYGFDVAGGMAVTPAQIIAGTRGIHPNAYRSDRRQLPPVDVNKDGLPIEAVLVFHHPEDWFPELQVATDVILGGVPVGAGISGVRQPVKQAAAVYISNPDFLWQAEYPVPRYGGGAFMECLKALWKRCSGGAELEMTQYGKPHPIQFRLAEKMVATLNETLGSKSTVRRFYMVGDNPSADVRGGNDAGDGWRPILVTTGVFQSGAPLTDVPWRVEENLFAAVEHLLQMSDEDHT